MPDIPLLIILRGSPAAGKTEVSHKLLSKMKGRVACIPVDDIQHLDRRSSPSKDKRRLGVINSALLARNFLKNKFDVIVEYVFDEDLGLCIDTISEYAPLYIPVIS